MSISSLRWVENILIAREEEKRNMYVNLYLDTFIPMPLLRHEERYVISFHYFAIEWMLECMLHCLSLGQLQAGIPECIMAMP